MTDPIVERGLEVVGWITDRPGDMTWPRLHLTEKEADYWIAFVTLPPFVTKRPVYARPLPEPHHG